MKVIELTSEEKNEAKRLSEEIQIDVGEAEVAKLYGKEGIDLMIVADISAERKLRRLGINAVDIVDIGFEAARKEIIDIKDFADAILKAGYRTKRVREILGL